MLLGGLWHGAAWNFILWGAYQGGILSIHRFFSSGEEKPLHQRLKLIITVPVFFLITCYGWLLFRSNSIHQIIDLTSILIFNWSDLSINIKRPPLVAFLAIPILCLYELAEYSTQNAMFYKSIWKPLFAASIAFSILLIAMGLSNEPAQFIYFQF
jgi:D-alanyl-lipoteichoic acid acyltransferase DltB (MBOAT superfamily)